MVGNIRRASRGEGVRIISDVGNTINSRSVVILSVNVGSSDMKGSWTLNYDDNINGDSGSTNLRTHSIVSGIWISISVSLYLLPYRSNNYYYYYNAFVTNLLGLL